MTTEIQDDPFAALEQAAKRQGAEEAAEKAVSAARSRLILGHVSRTRKDPAACFFATLALGLTPEPAWQFETAATDGKRLAYNPDYVLTLSPDALLGLVAHEASHPMLGHHARMGDRDPRRWNVACDCALNPILRDAGYVLPAGGLFPGEGKYKDLPKGLSAEEYYALLPDDPSGPGASGEGEGPGQDPGGCGAVMKPGDGSAAACRQSEAEWQTKLAAAHAAAKMRGQLPAGIDRLVAQQLAAKVRWQDVLREFVSAHAKNDYSWSPPNRRFLSQGFYLPGLRSQELGAVLLAVDTSGSVGERELARFAAEAQGILDAYQASLTILYHDAAVAKVQTWRSSDGPLVLTPAGGGGTSHRCVFDWCENNDYSPTVAVLLTDLYTEFPSHAPDFPCLWATVGNPKGRAPFGLTLPVE